MRQDDVAAAAIALVFLGAFVVLGLVAVARRRRLPLTLAAGGAIACAGFTVLVLSIYW